MAGYLRIPNKNEEKGNPPAPSDLKNPVFTYEGDSLSRVDYDNGSSKSLTYDSNGSLSQLVFDNEGVVITREFIYNSNGTLSSIIDT